MYKLRKTSKDSDDLPFGFLQSITPRDEELTETKGVKAIYGANFLLKVVFGFAESHESAKYVLKYQK